jgi:hypothetical protein
MPGRLWRRHWHREGVIIAGKGIRQTNFYSAVGFSILQAAKGSLDSVTVSLRDAVTPLRMTGPGTLPAVQTSLPLVIV